MHLDCRARELWGTKDLIGLRSYRVVLGLGGRRCVRAPPLAAQYQDFSRCARGLLNAGTAAHYCSACWNP